LSRMGGAYPEVAMYQTDSLRRTGVEGPHREFDRFADEFALEEIRQALRRELRTHAGQRSLARVVGVGRAVIRKLVEMRSVPEHWNMQRLREWVADRPAVETHVGAVSLALLVADLPPGERYAARLRLAEEITRLHVEAGVKVPQWLVHEVEDRRRR